MIKILIAESLDEATYNEITANSKLQFVYKPDISPLALEHEIEDYDGLIVRPKEVGEAVINNAKKLKLIIRGGAGVNSIALKACKENGIIVENTPGLNSDATAEFTFTMLLQLAKSAERMFELKGKRIGILGFGNIGKRVARIAEGFAMDIDIFTREKNLHEFLNAGHDFITLHLPLTPTTNNMIGNKEFELMRKNTILINTARPQLVEVNAFAEALNNGTLASYAIDGDEDLIEPFAMADPFGRGILTPHIADATFEAQSNITRAALTQAIEFFERGSEINRVI